MEQPLSLRERAQALVLEVRPHTLWLLDGYRSAIRSDCAALEEDARLEAMSEGDRFLDWASDFAMRTLGHRALLAEIDARVMLEDEARAEAGRRAWAEFVGHE